MRKMKKKLILAGVIFIAAVCLLPLPRRINATHEGVIWRCGGGGEVQSTGVTVKGTYHDHLFRGDAFKGSLRVEALPQTHGEMSVVSMGENQYGLWYKTDEALMQSLGSMYVGRDGSVLVLLHEDGHWDGDTGLMLTAPASTREEAVALANEMAQKLSPDWLGANPFE